MKRKLNLTPRTVNELFKVKGIIYLFFSFFFFLDFFSKNRELKFGNHDYEDSKKVTRERVCVSGLEIGRETKFVVKCSVRTS